MFIIDLVHLICSTFFTRTRNTEGCAPFVVHEGKGKEGRLVDFLKQLEYKILASHKMKTQNKTVLKKLYFI